MSQAVALSATHMDHRHRDVALVMGSCGCRQAGPVDDTAFTKKIATSHFAEFIPMHSGLRWGRKFFS